MRRISCLFSDQIKIGFTMALPRRRRILMKPRVAQRRKLWQLSCYLSMAGQNEILGRQKRWMESVCYPERRRRRQGQGRGRRLVAAWLGPALLLATTIHRPNAGHNFHPHVNRPHSRPPPPHPAQLPTRSRRPYSIHPSYSAAMGVNR